MDTWPSGLLQVLLYHHSPANPASLGLPCISTWETPLEGPFFNEADLQMIHKTLSHEERKKAILEFGRILTEGIVPTKTVLEGTA